MYVYIYISLSLSLLRPLADFDDFDIFGIFDLQALLCKIKAPSRKVPRMAKKSSDSKKKSLIFKNHQTVAKICKFSQKCQTFAKIVIFAKIGKFCKNRQTFAKIANVRSKFAKEMIFFSQKSVNFLFSNFRVFAPNRIA